MGSDNRSDTENAQGDVEDLIDRDAVDGDADPALEEQDSATLQEQLDVSLAKTEEYREQSMRLQADMENLRKRNERDVANAHKFGVEKIAAELLPVKDSLEMGISASAESGSINADKLIEGSELTLKLLTSALEKFKVMEINPLNDKFNPEYHEAMSIQERADVAPNTVVAVVQKGYQLNDRLIRPAMVIVSKAGPQEAGGQLDEQA